MKNIVEWSAVQAGDRVTLHNRRSETIKRTLEFVVEEVTHEHGIRFLRADNSYFPDTEWFITEHEVAVEPEPPVGSLVILTRHSDGYRDVWYRREDGWHNVSGTGRYDVLRWDDVGCYRTNQHWKYEEVTVNG